MTDEQIIKALECCTGKGKSCKECPAFVKVDRSKCRQYFIAALELIRRQQAEVDRLKDEICDIDTVNRILIKERAEAIKEFAEKVKQNLSFGKYITAEQIDNLVKEMGCGE